MGVTSKATGRTLDLIVKSADELGLLREIKGDQFVNLRAAPKPAGAETDLLYDEDADDDEDAAVPSPDGEVVPVVDRVTVVPKAEQSEGLQQNRRVFISHGKNTKIVGQLKELLQYGDFEPVVTVERETTSKPVPEKVLDDMRSCGAGIIHVGAERRLKDEDGNEHTILNQNVLIEIGAAMALYQRRFILLVEQGATLPSNLQGLYEVRYEGKELGGDATIKLLKAFNTFKE
jgi:hypothetical protein